MITKDRSNVFADFDFSNLMAETPEGFLLCRDVPIARIGVQQYLNSELPKVEGGKDGVIHVERREADVFSPDTIASFEGKPVTDNHPSSGVVEPDTYKTHVVGTTLNVRRGEGVQGDLLIADLLIMDADAIAAVRAGKREVSCGYDAEYESLGPGRARQYQIIGNHVALVKRGRCGSTCSIGDEDTVMAKTSFRDRVMAAFFTRDEEGMKEALKEKEEMPAKDEDSMAGSGVHVHLHTGPNGSTTEAPTTDVEDPENAEPAPEKKDIPTGDEKETAPGWFSDYSKMSDSRFDAIEKHVGMKKDEETKDASEGEAAEAVEEEGDMESEGDVIDEAEVPDDKNDVEEGAEGETMKDRKTNDAAPVLRQNFRSVLAGAEILAPGIKLPTIDSTASPKNLKDNMCLLKRRAIMSHAKTNDGAASIRSIIQNDTLNLRSMTCDAVGVLFTAAVGKAKEKNRGRLDLKKVVNDGARPTEPRTIAEFNQRKNDFYKTH